MDKRQKSFIIVLAIILMILIISFIYAPIKQNEEEQAEINKLHTDLSLTEIIRVENYTVDEEDENEAILFITNPDAVADIVALINDAPIKSISASDIVTQSETSSNYSLEFLDSDNNTILFLDGDIITYNDNFYQVTYNYDYLLEIIESVE